MKVAIIQTSLHWENSEVNRNHFTNKIKLIQEHVDLIVLPEMFTTGFTMNPNRVAETMEDKTVSWMKFIAGESQSAICGSVVIEENGNFYNRLLFVFPSGEIKQYDKRHLFTLSGEDSVYSNGTERLIIECKGYKICPLICYDLRFPVYSRNTDDYDLLLYVANWPKARTNAWDILLKARAVENMCFVIGVNRIGTDENGHDYTGHSQAVDFLGNYILEPQQDEGVFIVEFDRKEMLDTRNKLPFLNDRDTFTVSN